MGYSGRRDRYTAHNSVFFLLFDDSDIFKEQPVNEELLPRNLYVTAESI